MPHVTFVLKKHPASRAGGAQKQALIQAGALESGGWTISFISESEPAPAEDPPGRTLELPSRERYGELLNVPALTRAVRRLGPDLLYHRVSGLYTLPAYLAARLFDAKFVFAVANVRDCSCDQFRSKGQPETRGSLARAGVHGIRAVMDWSVRFALRRADLVLCQTPGQERLLHSLHGRLDTAVVQNVLPRSTGETGAGTQDAEPRILWVGKAAPQKQPSVFVELARSLQDVGEFRMAGVRPTDLSGDGAAQSGSPRFPPSLRCLGTLDSAELRDEYAAASLLVNTSRSEGFPNVFLEAWAAGCPVLSLWQDPDGLLERERVGWYAEGVADASRKIRTILGDSGLRRETGRRARELVERSFRPDAIQGRLNSCFMALLDR